MVQYYGEDYLPMGKNQKPDFTPSLQETLDWPTVYVLFRCICKVPHVLYSTLYICHLGRLCITYAVKSAQNIFRKNLHYKDCLSHYTLFMANSYMTGFYIKWALTFLESALCLTSHDIHTLYSSSIQC